MNLVDNCSKSSVFFLHLLSTFVHMIMKISELEESVLRDLQRDPNTKEMIYALSKNELSELREDITVTMNYYHEGKFKNSKSDFQLSSVVIFGVTIHFTEMQEVESFSPLWSYHGWYKV